MNEDNEFGYRARQILNQGLDRLDSKTIERLYQARQLAIDNQRALRRFRLAGISHNVEYVLLSNIRIFLSVMALSAGASGTYYWNAMEQAQEYAEIDSALLADELPPSAYLDRGFHVWLERASDSSSQ